MKIVQIYAGNNVSFAVDKNGGVYSWGEVLFDLSKFTQCMQNTRGQTGNLGGDYFTPHIIGSAPWNDKREKIIVTSKSHISYVFDSLYN